MSDADSTGADSGARAAAEVQDLLRTEIGLLHARVNALLAAEAFLTIAYTATMSSDERWARVVAPALAVLGLALALLSWPGVGATAHRVITLTGDAERGTATSASRAAESRRRLIEQRRSLLFFRGVPLLFAALWALFLVVALLPRS